MTKIFFILFILFSSQLFADNEFVGKKFLCKKLLWGFDFFSAEKVNVISTNINNKTNVEEYYYEIGIQLPYINLYLNKLNDRESLRYRYYGQYISNKILKDKLDELKFLIWNEVQETKREEKKDREISEIYNNFLKD